MSAATARKLTRVIEGPPPRTNRYSEIPEEVERFFRVNTGSVLSLSAAHPVEMATLHRTGRVPVHHKELPERLIAVLRSRGFMVNETDGTIRKMDCCLYRQSEEEREYNRELALYERLQREDPEALREAIEASVEEIERKGGRRGIARVPEGLRTPKIADFVHYDPSMADQED